MSTRSPLANAIDAEFDRLITARAIRVVFQPIVDLESEEVVGYEALARGPVDSAFADPNTLLAHAYRTGRIAELDWICRAAAFNQALAAGLPPEVVLFVNVEPLSLGTTCPPDLIPTMEAASGRLRVVLEMTERSLAADPAQLLAAVSMARQQSWGIALDDVGADPTSLAVMPLIGPDVIKLDLRLVQGRPTPVVARIVNAVLAEAERGGASILAEGIESPRHTAIARSMSANLGQGWCFGRPGPLPRNIPIPTHPIQMLPVHTSAVDTPFELVVNRRRISRATKELLLPMSMHLEFKQLDSSEPAVLLACFQDVRYFGELTRRRYRQLAAQGVLTGALGRGMPTEPGPGIRGAELAPDDPLANQWTVIVIGPHFAGALIAQDLGDQVPDARRRFDFVVTYDRELVIKAAQPLLRRLVPIGP